MTVLPETYSMFRRSYEMAQSEDVGYIIHELESAISRLAEIAKTEVGREQLRAEASRIEEAGMHLNGIIQFVLRQKA